MYFSIELVLSEFTFMRKLFNSLVTVIPQTINILLIILTVFFIYSVIGMELFSYLKFNTELNQHDQNYRDFSSSVFALVKFSLNESPIMQIINAGQEISPNFVCFDINSYEDFIRYGQMGCGSKAYSYAFFLSFHLIFSLVLMPTLMAVTFDVYSEVIREEEALVTKFQLQEVS